MLYHQQQHLPATSTVAIDDVAGVGLQVKRNMSLNELNREIIVGLTMSVLLSIRMYLPYAYMCVHVMSQMLHHSWDTENWSSLVFLFLFDKCFVRYLKCVSFQSSSVALHYRVLFVIVVVCVYILRHYFLHIYLYTFLSTSL